MDQMADEMTLRGDVKDKGRVNSAEESSTWARGERTQSEAQVSDWRLGAPSETGHGEISRDAEHREFSLKMYLRRPSSSSSSSTDSLSSSQQSSTGVDCAGMVLSCLFCRFYDIIHCCPSYKQVAATAESTASSNDDSHIDLDCGLLGSCQDAGDCLELAMEISELCYH